VSYFGVLPSIEATEDGALSTACQFIQQRTRWEGDRSCDAHGRVANTLRSGQEMSFDYLKVLSRYSPEEIGYKHEKFNEKNR